MTLLKSCNRCGCLIPYGKTYCPACQPVVDAYREEQRAKARGRANRRYNKTRDPKYARFYHSKEWGRLSAWYAQGVGFRCENCGAIASDVHHKDPIQTPTGWERRLDHTNLELLCVRCHNSRHNRFQPVNKRRCER